MTGGATGGVTVAKASGAGGGGADWYVDGSSDDKAAERLCGRW